MSLILAVVYVIVLGQGNKKFLYGASYSQKFICLWAPLIFYS